MDYEHPIYTPEAVRAQSQLGDLATGRTVYPGAYHGWGFHEDGCRLRRRGRPALRSGLVSTISLLTPASAPARPQLPPLPALVAGQVAHRRPGPVRHAFRHRVYQWLVDLDCLPRQPWHRRAFAPLQQR